MSVEGEAPPHPIVASEDDEEPTKVSHELKAMVAAGNDELPSNPNSLGWGIQQIKLDNWAPENTKYWEVRKKQYCFVHPFIIK